MDVLSRLDPRVLERRWKLRSGISAHLSALFFFAASPGHVSVSHELVACHPPTVCTARTASRLDEDLFHLSLRCLIHIENEGRVAVRCGEPSMGRR